MIKYHMSDIAKTRWARDCWWAVLVADPIAGRVVWLLANFTRVHPLAVTAVSLLLKAATAVLFILSVSYTNLNPGILYIAAVSFIFSFVLDCADGELARLTGKTTKVGRYLDRVGDFCGETAVLATFVYASAQYWNLMPNIIFAVLYWSGMAWEITEWFRVRNQPAAASGVSREFKNGIIRTVDDWFKKHRMGSHPSAVEGGVLAFGISPFFMLHPAFLGVGAILVLVDQVRFIFRYHFRLRTREVINVPE
jgi:phosphatidylglycerophosphate synthase